MEVFETNYSDRASKEYFEALIDAYAPLSALDYNYLKKIRRTRLGVSINKFMNMSYVEREEFIDLLTDLISSNPEADMDAYEEFKEKMKKLKKYGEKIENFTRIFKNRFNEYQQTQIIKDAIIKINSHLHIIYKILKEDVDKLIFDSKSVEFIIISKQILFICIKLANECENRLERTVKIDPTTAQNIFLIFILLLKLEAARRGKLDYKRLYEDITLVNTRTQNVLVEERVGSIFEVLNLET